MCISYNLLASKSVSLPLYVNTIIRYACFICYMCIFIDYSLGIYWGKLNCLCFTQKIIGKLKILVNYFKTMTKFKNHKQSLSSVWKTHVVHLMLFLFYYYILENLLNLLKDLVFLSLTKTLCLYFVLSNSIAAMSVPYYIC